MSETDLIDTDVVPASQQTDVEPMEADSKVPAWMKVRDAEVRKMSTERISMMDEEWVHVPVQANDDYHIKCLQDQGYDMAPMHPLVSEQNQTMVYRIKRQKYELKYKAEAQRKDRHENEMLASAARMGSTNSYNDENAPTTFTRNDMSLEDANNKLSEDDSKFEKQGSEMMDLFDKQLQEQ